MSMWGPQVPGADYKYPYQQLESSEDTVTRGASSHTILFSSVWKHPNKVLVLFLEQACQADDYQTNPACFLIAGVSDIVLPFNGGEVGRLRTNFKTGSAKQAYASLMRAIPRNFLEASNNGISFEDFRTNMPYLVGIQIAGLAPRKARHKTYKKISRSESRSLSEVNHRSPNSYRSY